MRCGKKDRDWIKKKSEKGKSYEQILIRNIPSWERNKTKPNEEDGPRVYCHSFLGLRLLYLYVATNNY